MKKGLLMMFALLILTVFGVSAGSAQETRAVVKSDMKLTLDGKSLALDESYLIDNSLFVPYRAFAEGIGGVVGYDDATKVVTVKKGDKNVEFTIGSDVALVNGATVKMVGPTTLINSSTFVHSRFLAEVFGIVVTYDDSTRSVNLVTDGGTAKVKTYTIQMSEFAFKEKEITVEAGSKITFTNLDGAKHNAIADDGSFKTKLLAKGESETITLDKPGVYTYYCEPHESFMRGTITVK